MRDQILEVLHNGSATSGVPISFWRHFADNEFTDAARHPEVLETNLAGHRAYLKEVPVDLVKTMLDGYFPYPFRGVTDPRQLAALRKLRPLASDDPWISGQVRLAQEQRKIAGDKPLFITVFSPLILLKWALITHYQEPLPLADRRFFDLYQQDPALIKRVLEIIATDQAKVVAALKKETDIDGIYYSTQSIQDPRADNHDFFAAVMEPIDLQVQEAINRAFATNILHICGFDGATNHLEWFTDYPLQVINWATKADSYSLGAGKRLFGNRVVLGGFDNSTAGVLYSGSKEEIQATVAALLREAGTNGVILGADCTVPRDIPYDHLKWAIEAAHQF